MRWDGGDQRGRRKEDDDDVMGWRPKKDGVAMGWRRVAEDSDVRRVAEDSDVRDGGDRRPPTSVVNIVSLKGGVAPKFSQRIQLIPSSPTRHRD
ncbi:hypothetical protein L6452_34567 [Arctium lappa]|uniref:Uncharacterized protein n=1 Tax=Arctium lappa TaxID=4217 RepID=A0ACB8YIK8_ARCLA|nr:hypothetical protein L6452_34567 [Arctium lappa]